MPLDAESFLNRILPTGSYIAIAFKGQGFHGLAHRFFGRNEVTNAARLARYLSNKGNEVWYATATYSTRRQRDKADANGNPVYTGDRKQNNAEHLKAFWVDTDILRPGDGKTIDKAYNNEAEIFLALKALKGKLELPNVIVKSGYGVHLYWVLADPIPAHAWLAHAQAFRAIVQGAGIKADFQCTTDSARLMRLPDTANFKVAGVGAPVFDMTPPALAQRGDYPNAVFLKQLGAAPSVAPSATLGAAPSWAGAYQGAAAAAAKATSTIFTHDYDPVPIAAGCLQTAKSLSEGGAHDPYPLWHLFVNVAHFCRNKGGVAFAHRVGEKYPTYTLAGTNAKLAATAAEQAAKNFGPPHCQSFDVARPGLCSACPHFAADFSPVFLGRAQPILAPLPHGFRRGNNCIEYEHRDGDGNGTWYRLIEGDLGEAYLRYIPGEGTHLHFDYVKHGAARHIDVKSSDVVNTMRDAKRAFGHQGVDLDQFNSKIFAEMTMAWIKQLNLNGPVPDQAPPFGWELHPSGGYTSLSVAGTRYYVDGKVEQDMSYDQALNAYRPQGSLERYRDAVNFITRDRPDLQAVVAVAPGSLLTQLFGESGPTVVLQGPSGVFKSAAAAGGAAFAGHPVRTIKTGKDTLNSVMEADGETGIIARYFDDIEGIHDPKQRPQISAMLQTATLGRTRARLDQLGRQREVHLYRNMRVIITNASLLDMLADDREYTEAAMLRVFEINTMLAVPQSIAAGGVVAQLESNYGVASQRFSQWLIQHVDEVQTNIIKIKEKIISDVSAVVKERFLINGVACIVAGAMISGQLGIFNFNVPKLYNFLLSEYTRQRTFREEEIRSDDCLEMLRDFCAINVTQRLLTRKFEPPGAHVNATRNVLSWPERRDQPPAYQTAIVDREMRIPVRGLRNWLRGRVDSPTETIREMQARWKADVRRLFIGAGTDHPMQDRVLSIPLNDPVLAAFLRYDDPTIGGKTAPAFATIQGGKA
jgi:hypothetical protein